MISMDFHGTRGFPWIPIDAMISMDFHGTRGFPWISMDSRGFPWISMDFRFPLISMECVDFREFD